MSDFVSKLGVEKLSRSYSFAKYQDATPEAQRAVAVGIALELVNSSASSSGGIYTEDLSVYADQIQAALKVNNN